jgi:hypothetical protein
LRSLKSPVLISNRLPSVKGKNFYLSVTRKLSGLVAQHLSGP